MRGIIKPLKGLKGLSFMIKVPYRIMTQGITTVQDKRDVINSLNITLLALEEGEGPSIGNINFHIKATREQVTELKRVMRIYGPASIRFHYFP